MNFNKILNKNFFLGIIIAIISLLMIFIPNTCIKVIVILVGAATLINGIYTLVKFYDLNNDKTYKKILLIKCITGIIIGLIAVLFPIFLMKSISAIWNIITFILAFYCVVYAMAGFFSSAFVKNLDEDVRKRITSESFIYLLIAIILFVIPIGAVIETIFRIAGIVALVIAIIIIAREFTTKKDNIETK